VREDRTLAGWGYNWDGQTRSPEGLSDVRMADGGELHGGALREDGTVVCWGSNAAGQCAVPVWLDDAIWITTGSVHTVAVRADGSVLCWGYGGMGICTPPPGLGPVASVAAGSYHTIARLRDGSVACWGSNEYGQCATPVGLSEVNFVSAGDRHSLAIRADGTLIAWGWNTQGQASVPPDLGPVRAAAGGHVHTLVARPDGSVAAWGMNAWGQCTVPADLGTIVAVEAGQYHSISLDDRGVVRCWGMNLSGECVVPRSPRAVVDLAAGESHSLACGEDGRVTAWGRGDYRQNAVPADLGPSIAVAAGKRHSLALRADGLVVAWGDDTYGQGTVPAGVAALPMARIRSGWYHNLSLESWPDNRYRLYCWGMGDSGQCSIPIDAQFVVDAAGGGAFTIACLPNGVFRGWGSNSHGQLTPPGGYLSPVIRVAAGAYHSVALKSDGTVRAFGWNEWGQCNVPPGLAGVVAIGAGYYHSVALKGDGSIVAWGLDAYYTGVLSPPNDEGPFDALASGFWNGLARRSPVDTDGDGVTDSQDTCPCTVDADQADSDGDGRGDACDGCPADPLKRHAGDCGCGQRDLDLNLNGTADCLDDSDGDGVPDVSDGCPMDGDKTEPGVCGCGVVDEDLDGDQRIDCVETWEPETAEVVVVPDGEAGDLLGAAIATDDAWLVVGVPGDDSGRGSVAVLARSDSSWVERQRLVAPSRVAGDGFGTSVAISGDLLVVGAPGTDLVTRTDAGMAHVFRLAAGTWVHERTLVRSGAQTGDGFGTAVAARGSLVACGAPGVDQSGAVNSGVAYVFKRSGSTWNLTCVGYSMPLTAGDRYGTSLDFNAIGAAPMLAVGAPRDDLPGQPDCGAIYVLRLTEAGGSLGQRRLVSPGSRTGAELGWSVAIDGPGTTLAAGGPFADLDGPHVDAGFATVWTLAGGTWFGSTLFPTVPETGARFASAIDLDPSGGLLMVGSPRRTTGGITERGLATLFRRYGGMGWDVGTALEDGASGTASSRFGSAVAAGTGVLASGGPNHAPPEGGAIAVFNAPASCVGDDSDGDGLSDACDGCPNDIAKSLPETCGCGVPETDSDVDGTLDCIDGCPDDAGKTSPGSCGCGVPDVDTDLDAILDCDDPDDDNDGAPDGSDGCPVDPLKTDPGTCGCGVADTDGDLDGTPACLEACDDDPAKTEPGTCGCGVADDDLDADGLVDCLGGGTLDELETILDPSNVAGDNFGASLATDGSTLAVGAPYDDVSGRQNAGRVSIFVRDGSGAWILEARLVAPTAIANELFGSSVAVEGDTVVVGAPLTDVGGLADAGAAYRYLRDGSGAWSHADTLHRPGGARDDRFGFSVAVRGGLVAVGSPRANAVGLAGSGEARVYREDSGHLVEFATATGESAGDMFGQSVALAEDAGARMLISGVPGDDEPGKVNCGAVHLIPLDGGSRLRLVPPTPAAYAVIGTRIAATADGRTVAASAPTADVPGIGNDCGEVVTWTLDGGTWTAREARPADLSAGERLGSSLSLADDGRTLLAGSAYDTVDGISGRGSAVVLVLGADGWRTFDRLTLPAGGTAISRFGTAVALTSNTALVGGPLHTPPAGGTVREFSLPPP
jgi:alpha-tubulin suppressor-like RCC1 family protein